jgi:GTPase
MNDNEFHLPLQANPLLISVISHKVEGHQTTEETRQSLVELYELTRTLGLIAEHDVVQNKQTLEAGTILGTGKLEEIKNLCAEKGLDLLIFDLELSATQVRNIKRLTGINVIDRCHVILEIFARHARTREAKIQIEVARLQYMLPRLTGLWSHFSRQRGGVGVRGGEGEQQIELDRRIIKTRIEFYKRELLVIEKSREQQRKKRQNEAIIAALVGYTNAGKSSLMNRLCRVSILEEDKLFATLDSTYRTLNPDSHPPMILVDTVGFISNLPNTLIDGFKTTLDSALEADLLLVVCDISDPQYEKHLRVTEEVLTELKVNDKEKFYVFTKADKLHDPLMGRLAQKKYPHSFLVSTFNPEDMDDLRQKIVDYFLSLQGSYELFIPYELGDKHAIVLSKTNVDAQHAHEKGIFYRLRVPDFIFAHLGLRPFLLGPDVVSPFKT